MSGPMLNLDELRAISATYQKWYFQFRRIVSFFTSSQIIFKLVIYNVIQGVSHQLTLISCSYLDQLVRYTTLNFVGIHLKIHILTENLQNMFCSLYMRYETVQSSHGLYSTKCRLSVNTNIVLISQLVTEVCSFEHGWDYYQNTNFD